jgi:hypothetical protein
MMALVFGASVVLFLSGKTQKEQLMTSKSCPRWFLNSRGNLGVRKHATLALCVTFILERAL